VAAPLLGPKIPLITWMHRLSHLCCPFWQLMFYTLDARQTLHVSEGTNASLDLKKMSQFVKQALLDRKPGHPNFLFVIHIQNIPLCMSFSLNLHFSTCLLPPSHKNHQAVHVVVGWLYF